MEVLREFSDRELTVKIISNFAKMFSDDELDALLTLAHLTVSIDTVSADVLRRVRRSVQLGSIASNLVKLRMRARKRQTRMPYVLLNAVLYVDNLAGIEDLAYFAVENRVNGMQYERMQLHELWASDAPIEIRYADPKTAEEALRQIDVARKVLQDNGIAASFHGDLIDVLQKASHG